MNNGAQGNFKILFKNSLICDMTIRDRHITYSNFLCHPIENLDILNYITYLVKMTSICKQK